jgi:WD40 repeat protein
VAEEEEEEEVTVEIEAALLCVAVSPGNLYIAAGEDGVEEGEGYMQGKPQKKKKNGGGRCSRRPAVGGRVVIWSGARLEFVAALEGHERGSGVTCVAWSPCGRLLASGGFDAKVLLWQTKPLCC